jgi:hypothetical protein
VIFFKQRLLSKTSDQIRYCIRAVGGKGKKAKDAPEPNVDAIWVNPRFNLLEPRCLELLGQFYDRDAGAFKNAELDQSVNDAMKARSVLSQSNRREWMPFLTFIRESVPEFGDFLLAHEPTIDQLAFYHANEKWFLRQIPGYKAVFFFDVATVTKEEVPGGLWDDQAVNAARAYQSTATVAFVP